MSGRLLEIWGFGGRSEREADAAVDMVEAVWVSNELVRFNG